MSLLELDGDLAPGIGTDAIQAGPVPARVITLPAGRWTPPENRPSNVIALLVVDGFMLRRRPVGDRTVAQVVGPRDVFDPWVLRETPGAVEWFAVTPVKVAVLDERVFLSVRAVPELAAGLFRRMAENNEHAAAMAAVVHLPRAEQRVLAVLWRLVERWGRVRSDGYLLELPLTHVMIGQLTGARRPTVSLALAQLAESGHLTRLDGDGWLLARDAGPPAPRQRG